MGTTATDFKLLNSSPHFVDQVNKTLDYYRANDPGAEAKLQQGHDMGIQIMYNPPGNPLLPPSITGGIDITGQDMMVLIDGRLTILYNPDSALLVTDGHGRVQGIESPSSGFVHEFEGHGLHGDSDWLLSAVSDTVAYQWFNERVAVNAEDVFNALAGEPLRDNHGGTEVNVSDVTAHTIMTEDGALQLVRMGADGRPEYGPQIAITGPGWQNLQRAFDQANTATQAGAAVTIDGIAFVVGHRNAASGADFYSDPEPTNGGYRPDFGASDFAQVLRDGEGWQAWSGDLSEGGGGDHSQQRLEDKSSDDPDYQFPSHMSMQIGQIGDAPADLFGGTDWLAHMGQGAALVGAPHAFASIT